MSKLNLSQSRRNFLKKGVTGLAGITILPSTVQRDKGRGAQDQEKTRKMIYRTLGKTGLKLPIISMGVMNADNPHLVRAALDAGIVHLDTAWYYQKCEKCMPQCPRGLHIPTYMRSYMYAYGHRNLCAAKEAVDSIPLSQNECSDCLVCSVRCAMGHDVKTRIMDIIRIKDMPDDFLV